MRFFVRLALLPLVCVACEKSAQPSAEEKRGEGGALPPAPLAPPAASYVEAPNAPGPPPDGAPLGVLEFREGAKKGMSKWKGARVRVKGFFESNTTAGSDTQGVTLAVSGEKRSMKEAVSCRMPPGSTPPALTPWADVTVEGVVADDFSGGLVDCKVIEPAAGAASASAAPRGSAKK